MQEEEELMRLRLSIVAMTIGVLLIGGGVLAKPWVVSPKSLAQPRDSKATKEKAATRPTSSHPIHRVNAGRMSVVLPANWSQVSRTTTYGVTTWTFQGNGNQLQLSATPMALNYFQLLPMKGYPSGTSASKNHGPYQRETVQSGGTMIIDRVLSAGGTFYRFDLQTGPGGQSLATTILKSWRHPKTATVTDAVDLIRQAAPGLPSYAQSFPNSNDGWILVGGAPATAQEGFYLFQTQNAGKSWTLERYTQWSGCSSTPASCTFLGGAGDPSMVFWNGQDGIITEAMMAVAQIAVYRTEDGGRTWSFALLPLPHQPQNAVLTHRGSMLTLTISFFGKRSQLVETSPDGGLNWTPIPAEIPTGQ